jgi:hypothetical protein
MWMSLLAHVILPGTFGLTFVVFSLVAENRPYTWIIAVDAGLDLAILSIGATGALLESPQLVARFGADNVLVGLAVVAVNLLISSFMLLCKRLAGDRPEGVSRTVGMFCLFLGTLTMVVVGTVTAWGFRMPAVASK